MAGKNKGGREVKKPKVEAVKKNASQPTLKGVPGVVAAPAKKGR